MMQMRLGIAMVLNSFKVSPSEKTLIPIKYQPEAQVIGPISGMYVLEHTCD